MPTYVIGEKRPQIDPAAWIAANATVIGDVRLAANSSIWWNAVLRGDNDPIHIGENSNIQDGSVLHTDEGVPMHIGRNVTVGHLVMLHGCTVGDGSLIGIGSIVLNRAPTASNLNFVKGDTYPNLTITKVGGTDGKVKLANQSAGTTYLLADVAGYFLK